MYRNRASSCIPVGLACLLSACAAGTEGRAPAAESQEATGAASAEHSTAQSVEAIAARAAIVNVEPDTRTDDDTICRKESVTGSHRSRTICQTQEQRRAVRSAAQEWFRTGGRQGEVSRVPTVQ